MSKKKLVEDIRQNPSRFYRSPADVIRDRRFSDEERLVILEAWEAADETETVRVQVAEARRLIEERAAPAKTS
jgi:hypothetical protein